MNPKRYLVCLYKFIDFEKQVNATCVHHRPNHMVWQKAVSQEEAITILYSESPELFFGFDHYKTKKGIKAFIFWLWYTIT